MSDDTTNASSYYGATPEQQIERLTAMLLDCEKADTAAAAFRRCTGSLSAAGFDREVVWGFLFNLLEEYAGGVELPNMANIVLLEAKEAGLSNDVMVAAAKASGVARGDNPKKNLRDRLRATKTRDEVREGAANPIPVVALARAMEMQQVIRDRLLEVGRRRRASEPISVAVGLGLDADDSSAPTR